jgi:hypothetical protein
MAASKTAAVPVFRGRNVSLSEIAQTSGIGMATIKNQSFIVIEPLY